MAGAVIAAAASLLVAVITYGLNQRAQARLLRRNGELERVNAQLGDLYGPLLAIFEVSSIANTSLRAKLRPGQDKYFRGDVEQLTEEEYGKWRGWIELVFAPGNRRAREIIYTKSHLFIDAEIPPALLEWCAHTQEYEVVIAQWKNGDYSEADTKREFSEFAEELSKYLRESYINLKTRQVELLRQTRALVSNLHEVIMVAARVPCQSAAAPRLPPLLRPLS